jgi:hypothetical protein
VPLKWGLSYCSSLAKPTSFLLDAPGDGDDSFDITDDWTGELHDIARRHIPPYVNEICSPLETPTVHARHDCEGALHYLLGHAGKDDAPFQLRADGKTEIEVFVDYGPKYEKVRLRKGFTRLSPDEEARCLKELEKDEQEYLEEIESYSVSDVSSSLEYFRALLVTNTPRDLGEEFLIRSLVVVLLLKGRVRSVEVEMFNLADDDSICDNGYTDIAIPGLVAAADKLVYRLMDQWRDDSEIMQRLLSRDFFVHALKKLLKKGDLESLTPKEFRNLIDGM